MNELEALAASGSLELVEREGELVLAWTPGLEHVELELRHYGFELLAEEPA